MSRADGERLGRVVVVVVEVVFFSIHTNLGLFAFRSAD